MPVEVEKAPRAEVLQRWIIEDDVARAAAKCADAPLPGGGINQDHGLQGSSSSRSLQPGDIDAFLSQSGPDAGSCLVITNPPDEAGRGAQAHQGDERLGDGAAALLREVLQQEVIIQVGQPRGQANRIERGVPQPDDIPCTQSIVSLSHVMRTLFGRQHGLNAAILHVLTHCFLTAFECSFLTRGRRGNARGDRILMDPTGTGEDATRSLAGQTNLGASRWLRVRRTFVNCTTRNQPALGFAGGRRLAGMGGMAAAC
jgi:hypothetical protein